MSQSVAEVLVDVLERVGVKQVFGLIGDSLNPLGDAIRRSSIEWIGVRHEEGAALAASGQAKFTGRLAVCAGTTGPGSNHLVAGLYEASRDHAPVLALSGEMPRKMKGTDFFQATEPDLLFRDVSLYTQTITSAEQAPLVVHQAIAAAYAGPGVAHLTLRKTSFPRKLSARRQASPHCSRALRSHRMNPASQRLLNGSMPRKAW
jgi:pyruvate dehydrogenase (quinone)